MPSTDPDHIHPRVPPRIQDMMVEKTPRPSAAESSFAVTDQGSQGHAVLSVLRVPWQSWDKTGLKKFSTYGCPSHWSLSSGKGTSPEAHCWGLSKYPRHSIPAGTLFECGTRLSQNRLCERNYSMYVLTAAGSCEWGRRRVMEGREKRDTALNRRRWYLLVIAFVQG